MTLLSNIMADIIRNVLIKNCDISAHKNGGIEGLIYMGAIASNKKTFDGP